MRPLGRKQLYGRCTFQVVEEFDDTDWSIFRDHQRRVRDELQQGARHVFEAEMKETRRTKAGPDIRLTRRLAAWASRPA